MISEEEKEKLFKTYPEMLIVVCGDLGYQLPAVMGTPMTDKDFGIVVELTKNYRFQNCQKQQHIINEVRQAMKDKRSSKYINDYIKQQYQNITIRDMLETYKKEDMIMCATHAICDEYTTAIETRDDGKYSKYLCYVGTCDQNNGEVKYEDGTGRRYRHGYTVHSVQGETYDDKIFIDLRHYRDARHAYTAISRARYANQIYIIDNKNEAPRERTRDKKK